MILSIFSCAYCYLYIFCRKCLFKSCVHFLIGLFVFQCWPVRVLLCSSYKFFIRYTICKYVLLICELCFYFLDGVLRSTEGLIFKESNLLFLSLGLLVSHLRRNYQTHGHKDSFLSFLPRILEF